MKRICLALCVVFATQQAFSQNSNISKYLSEITDLKEFSGSVIVSQKGEIVLNEGYGLADRENNIKNTSESVHRIGSLTKPLTAIGLLKLLEDSISIHTGIGKYIPTLPDAWQKVSFYHLLTHTSGIPDHFGDLDAVPVEDTYEELEKVFEQEKDSKLKDTPGESFDYSNFGYIVLGRLIEVISDQSYSDYMKNAVFEPLNMMKTAYDDPRILVTGRTQGYKFSREQIVNDALKDPAAYSAGGMLSTSEDLKQLSQALKTDILLTEKQRRLMFTAFKGDYGLGWQILEKNGKLMYNHNGGTHGFSSRIVYYPAEELFIAVLANNEDIRAAAITCDIEGMIFDPDTHVNAIPYTQSVEQLHKLSGDYFDESGEQKRSISFKDGHLYYVSGPSEFKLMSLSESLFCFYSYEDIRIQFSDNSFEISTCSVDPANYQKR